MSETGARPLGVVDLTVRRAVAGDARALAELAERTFRDAFDVHTAPADMAMFCTASYSEARQSTEIADPAVETWLIDDREGSPIAFLQLRVGVFEESPGGVSSVELWRFYVTRDWQGRGLAQAMMALVFERARALGVAAVWLGVWEHNERAKAFYGKCGFVVYAEHPFVLGTDHQRDLLMSAPVAVT